ncbi:CHC2-type zinc finger protein [Algoriphagus boseongensis]|uniref:CHC2-type zinc finger protein n=1 Tax=Algoriphagus boseongensis TaxID=1442587 RepID=A0A4V3D1Y7_9BACT|nr:CHC2 zinc finger domain-containing protein [Algoriphagus boseongensis]TDQ15209.1 CHC2-type zinc finger protein [Algoriphagus boseongensis]
MITKRKIMHNSLQIFDFYLGNKYPFGRVIPGKNISNPFLTTKQNTPSFNVFKGKDGDYLFKDYGTGEVGNVITFVIKMEKTNFQKAVEIISQILR